MLANLSENVETHSKIVKSLALKSIQLLIIHQVHFDVTYYCTYTLSNITRTPNNIKSLLKLKLHKDFILKLLPSSDLRVY